MYKKILLALGNSPADRPIIEHLKELAKIMGSHVVLLHVATGTAAQFHGDDAGGKEVDDSKSYLAKVKQEFEAAGIGTSAELGFGDAVKEITKWVEEKGCDLVAMGTHGHRLIADLFLGATATKVQHNISVPVLLLRAK